MATITHDKPPLYDLSGFTVLLVEDSVYMQNLISSMLKVFGVGDILVCSGGEEAQEILTVTQARTKSRYVNSIDIILTDWLMPQGSGQDLLRWTRYHEKDEIRFLPVIVVSGYTTETLTHQVRDLGANETLTKPISGQTMAGRICSVIDHPRPFIQTDDFFGPDRRRQDILFSGDDKRASPPNMIEVKL